MSPADPVEKLFTTTIDYRRVLEERQNFDVSAQYAKADVARPSVNRKRQR